MLWTMEYLSGNYLGFFIKGRCADGSFLSIYYKVFFFQAEDGIRDTSVTGGSDVCSSDLNWYSHSRHWKRRVRLFFPLLFRSTCESLSAPHLRQRAPFGHRRASRKARQVSSVAKVLVTRSEERRVGKECRSRWTRHESKEN